MNCFWKNTTVGYMLKESAKIGESFSAMDFTRDSTQVINKTSTSLLRHSNVLQTDKARLSEVLLIFITFGKSMEF